MVTTCGEDAQKKTVSTMKDDLEWDGRSQASLKLKSKGWGRKAV